MRLVLPAVFLCLLATPALAQTSDEAATRAEELRREREEKAANVTPPKPDPIQRGLDFIEQRGLLLTARDGFHPKIGSLTTGSGFAFGLGYRSRGIFNRYGSLETFAAGSFSKYWALETRAHHTQLVLRDPFA